jgi:hypothetical protein
VCNGVFCRCGLSHVDVVLNVVLFGFSSSRSAGLLNSVICGGEQYRMWLLVVWGLRDQIYEVQCVIIEIHEKHKTEIHERIIFEKMQKIKKIFSSLRYGVLN